MQPSREPVQLQPALHRLPGRARARHLGAQRAANAQVEAAGAAAVDEQHSPLPRRRSISRCHRRSRGSKRQSVLMDRARVR